MANEDPIDKTAERLIQREAMCKLREHLVRHFWSGSPDEADSVDIELGPEGFLLRVWLAAPGDATSIDIRVEPGQVGREDFLDAQREAARKIAKPGAGDPTGLWSALALVAALQCRVDTGEVVARALLGSDGQIVIRGVSGDEGESAERTFVAVDVA